MSCSSSLGRHGEEGCLVCTTIPPIIDLSPAAVFSPSLAEAQLWQQRQHFLVFDPSLASHQFAETTALTCSSLIPCTELWGGKSLPVAAHSRSGSMAQRQCSLVWSVLCSPWDVNLYLQTFFFLFS